MASLFNRFASLAALSLIVRCALALDPATGLPGSWTYQGCYLDVIRTINDKVVTDDGMTGLKCIEACQSAGFKIAGTEFSKECFCGNSLKAGSGLVKSTDCTKPCGGKATEACGGPNRLTLYSNGALPALKGNANVKFWPYRGCYVEGKGGRMLTQQMEIAKGTNNAVNCVSACRNAAGGPYHWAGTEYAGQCFCGNELKNGGGPAPDGEKWCQMSCTGDSNEACGGPDHLSVYELDGSFSPPSGISCPGENGRIFTTANGKKFEVECSLDHVGSDIGGVRKTSSLDNCLELCSTESGCQSVAWHPAKQDCWLKNSVPAGRVDDKVWGGKLSTAGTTGSVSCPDDNGTTYRAPNAKDFVVECGIDHPGSDIGVPRSAASLDECINLCSVESGCLTLAWHPDNNRCYLKNNIPNGNPNPDVHGAKLVTTGKMPTGWTYKGCWVDNVQGRILPVLGGENDDMTNEYCAQVCTAQGFTVSGTQFARQCYCGNFVVNGGKLAANDGDCNMGCAGDGTQKCGGPNRFSLYSPAAIQTTTNPLPQKTGLPTSWDYAGCLKEFKTVNGVQSRVFAWQLVLAATNTPKLCIQRCQDFGYHAAALEFGQECYCGDPADVLAASSNFDVDTACNKACPGDPTVSCGAGDRLAVYYWKGAPLNEFQYPQGANAGIYKYLISAPMIPIMATQAINGKVVLMEKYGTGLPNSTGTYELDLTRIDDYNAAWHTLHVKTDLFCSAGVTLPDTAGRLLNLGGWFGQGTPGVRLLWPDGSPGVKGTNDWQEDQTKLALQSGRWYPTAMIMPNGSVAVVGGVIDDNIVPTLELFPPTGTPPIVIPFLGTRNGGDAQGGNFYPFMIPLPSGGLFIVYTNMARILDAKTFNTVKTLPQIPGAVNSDDAGRTFPYSGTAVPLPMRAPFNSPMEVLICGGSGPKRQGLDNCVTTAPDAASPKWVLERMPSKRLMTMMAPLPDGTYLIAGGAYDGYANFRGGNGPNNNAVLYNPKLPVGKRMSVMANTTIARMYHSEVTTLLDGRVLIAGSDPQDARYPQEYRLETFTPPYLLRGDPRPTFSVGDKDWTYGDKVTFTMTPGFGSTVEVSLLAAVTSTHGNSMGARTLFLDVGCAALACTLTAPPNANLAPPGWYMMFVLDGGIPAPGVYVRIGGDPAGFGAWPADPFFKKPGLG